ncbi:hypothetical protein EJ04DRAFT_566407 [Polyplosphaeria fusca]|uniref:Uncharacterized protein n=1 Tax=Polyplosphaeria fusca TaxID=682080 RepID=A0A9P4V0C7_9PLEO|nr:hypothetical protein EJ04DRAFT_566407 [Polyplosphaeria fusca]
MSFEDRLFDIQDYVYEGLWKNHHEGRFRTWTWTLSDSRALVGLAFLSLLIAFTQTRSWVLLRYIIYQRTKSLRLEDTSQVDPLLQLTQGTAITGAWRSIKAAAYASYRRSQRANPNRNTQGDEWNADELPIASSFFGVFALINICAFVIAGVVVPWALSGGSLENPIVKTKITSACLDAYAWQKVWQFLHEVPKVDSILQQCGNEVNGTCNTPYYTQQPQVSSRRLKDCPFKRDICMNNTMAIEMLHANISAYEMGVNSAAGITMNHRLTCVPVRLDNFYRFNSRKITSDDLLDPDTPIWHDKNGIAYELLNAAVTVMEPTKFTNNFTDRVALLLETANGPHGRFKENSGRLMAEKGTLPHFNVLPDGKMEVSINKEDFNSAFQIDNALPFLAVYRAGFTKYFGAVDDPFLAAHNADEENPSSFYADHEATALGCSEQFQFCHSSLNNCTSWTKQSFKSADQLLDNLDLSIEPHDDIQADVIAFFRMAPFLFSVHTYLRWRSTNADPDEVAIPLIFPKAWILEGNDYNNRELWVTEVQVWFAKAILGGILSTRHGARWPLEIETERYSLAFKRKYGLCGRILFRHAGYTNISWAGTWCTIFALLFICLASYTVEPIRRMIKTLRRMVSAGFILLRYLRQRSFRDVLSGRFPFKSAGRSANWDNDIEMTPPNARPRENRVNREYEDIDGVI